MGKKLPILNVALLIILVSLTVAVWRWTNGFVKTTVQARFVSDVDKLELQIKSKIRDYLSVTRGGKALFVASSEVTEMDFHQYFDTFMGPEKGNYTGLYSVTFVRRLADFDLPAFAARHSFKLEPDTSQKEHYFIDYVHSNKNDLVIAWGIDLAADEVRRVAFQKARDSGQPTVVGPIDIKAPARPRGFLVTLPIYKNGLPVTTVAERQRALLGFVNGVFVYKDFIEAIIPVGTYKSVDFSVVDQGLEVYKRANNGETQVLKNHLERNIAVADRSWYVNAHRSLGAPYQIEESLPIIVLTLGVVISFLVFAMLYGLFSLQKRAVTLAEQMTSELKKKSEYIETVLADLPIGIAVNEIDSGRVVYMNKAFEDTYGWSKEVLTSVDAFFEKVYPDPKYREVIKKRILGDIASGDPARMQWEDVEVTTKSGEKRFVSAKNIAVPTQNLMVSTVVDTTSRKKAKDVLEKKMEELKQMNDLMVGRELRMAQMKKEMREVKGGGKNG